MPVRLFAPSRVRGLKHDIISLRVSRCLFAPSRVRGLKPFIFLSFSLAAVRTFTGAWIETLVCH